MAKRFRLRIEIDDGIGLRADDDGWEVQSQEAAALPAVTGRRAHTDNRSDASDGVVAVTIIGAAQNRQRKFLI